MIKILSTSQIKELDAFTIKNEPIASIDLMERACSGFVEWFIERYDSSKSVLVICGTGNNGGDGLGIARLLSWMPYNITVLIVQSSSESEDFQKNLKRLPPHVDQSVIQNPVHFGLPSSDIIIDALFGSGLSRPLEGIQAKVVSAMNQSNAIRIAVDIPSGLLADSHTFGPVVQAHHTVTFQLPKLSFLLPYNYSTVGEWHMVDIGLSRKFIAQASTRNYLVDEIGIQELIRPRKKYSHKGDFGHSLIIGGSLGKMGANILATKAALRTGSGLVTSLVPKCGYTAIQSSLPEAMALMDPQENFLSHMPDIRPFNSIGIGPGIGKNKLTIEFVKAFFESQDIPCVIDADALNILSENGSVQNLIYPNSILTPHPGEFRRLVGEWQNDFERLELQRQLATRLKSIVVLKGAHTSIAMPTGEVYFNTTGNPAMATGGSGDVLTGILTALLAQQYPPQDAALLGVFLHGLAGDLASKNRHAIIASDIIEEIPFAFQWLGSVEK